MTQNKYPQRIAKSENVFALWEAGEGDIAELAICLYDLTAEYKALWEDYEEAQATLSSLLGNGSLAEKA